MFKRITLVVLLLFVAPMTAHAEEKIMIDQKMLMQMSNDARNTLFYELKKQAPNESTQAVDDTINFLAGVNIESFKGKALAVADALNAFCAKIGITVNDFIKTPAGNFLIFGALYKLGVFGSIWSLMKGVMFSSFLVWIILRVNTRKKITLEHKDDKGVVIESEDILVPHFSGIFSMDKDGQSIFAIIVSIIAFIALCITVFNM